MQVSVIQIGNSRGLRLPKLVLDQLKFGTTAELTVHKDRLVIEPGRKPRQGWAEGFRELAKAQKKNGANDPTLQKLKNRFDQDEWSW